MYSRRVQVEERKNRKKTYLFISLTIISIGLIFFYGLPAVIRFAGFLTDLRKTSQPVETNDSTPPPPPRISALPKATSKYSVEVSGYTEAGAIVKIFYNGKEEEVIANSEGNFSANISLNDGVNKIYALAKDSSGNESQSTDIFELIFDNTPPTLEISKPSDGSEYFGNLQRQLVIEGNTEENVQIQINSRMVVVDQDQSFSFATTLSEGENTFEIKAEDQAGNKSEKTLKVFYAP